MHSGLFTRELIIIIIIPLQTNSFKMKFCIRPKQSKHPAAHNPRVPFVLPGVFSHKVVLSIPKVPEANRCVIKFDIFHWSHEWLTCYIICYLWRKKEKEISLCDYAYVRLKVLYMKTLQYTRSKHIKDPKECLFIRTQTHNLQISR